jgi:hypothetical protein
MQKWKLFVKYQKVKRNRKCGVYYGVMKKLKDLVDVSDSRLIKA